MIHYEKINYRQRHRRPARDSFTAVAVFMAAIVLMTFISACRDRDEDDEDKNRAAQPVKPPAEISFENGATVLTLDAQTQNRLGIETTALSATSTRTQLAAPATVLSVQDLATFRNAYLATQSQLEKTRVDLDVAQKEYARLKMLFDANRNASEKALQSAEGSMRSLEADERSELQQLDLQSSIVQQDWGGVIAKWARDGSPELGRVFNMAQALLQVTLPPEAGDNAPSTLLVEIPVAGNTRPKTASADLVSPFPRVDARIQGRSFLYIASAQPGFTPGMNLLAHIATGKAIRGVFVPENAVVWSEGKPWVYAQAAADKFARREVPSDTPVANGFFVSRGFAPGDKAVTRGAQALLSEESVLQGYGGGGDVD